MHTTRPAKVGYAGPLFPGGGQPAAGDTEQDSPGPDGVCTRGTLLDSSSLSRPPVNPAYTCRLCLCTSYKAGPHLHLQVLPRLITKASLCSGLARCPPMESRPPSGPGPHIRGVYPSQKEPRFHPDGLSAGSSGRVCSKTLQAGVVFSPRSPYQIPQRIPGFKDVLSPDLEEGLRPTRR